MATNIMEGGEVAYDICLSRGIGFFDVYEEKGQVTQ